MQTGVFRKDFKTNGSRPRGGRGSQPARVGVEHRGQFGWRSPSGATEDRNAYLSETGVLERLG
ncbi:hypothetical protein [Streptomyces sp. XY152]|uniref:hypothetical protein n=1 Tax=Streptomyces sp. XY152 TaxID=1415560 RepID=UPI00131D8A44|nr:hypothetical protein [Streptomyces sp. XY152]